MVFERPAGVLFPYSCSLLITWSSEELRLIVWLRLRRAMLWLARTKQILRVATSGERIKRSSRLDRQVKTIPPQGWRGR